MVIIVEFILFFLRMINTFFNNIGKALDIYCSYETVRKVNHSRKK